MVESSHRIISPAQLWSPIFPTSPLREATDSNATPPSNASQICHFKFLSGLVVNFSEKGEINFNNIFYVT